MRDVELDSMKMTSSGRIVTRRRTDGNDGRPRNPCPSPRSILRRRPSNIERNPNRHVRFGWNENEQPAENEIAPQPAVNEIAARPAAPESPELMVNKNSNPKCYGPARSRNSTPLRPLPKLIPLRPNPTPPRAIENMISARPNPTPLRAIENLVPSRPSSFLTGNLTLDCAIDELFARAPEAGPENLSLNLSHAIQDMFPSRSSMNVTPKRSRQVPKGTAIQLILKQISPSKW